MSVWSLLVERVAYWFHVARPSTDVFLRSVSELALLMSRRLRFRDRISNTINSFFFFFSVTHVCFPTVLPLFSAKIRTLERNWSCLHQVDVNMLCNLMRKASLPKDTVDISFHTDALDHNTRNPKWQVLFKWILTSQQTPFLCLLFVNLSEKARLSGWGSHGNGGLTRGKCCTRNAVLFVPLLFICRLLGK